MIDFDDINFLEDAPRNASISIISDIDASKANIYENEISEDKEVPILPLRNTMLFPGTLLPITIGRRSSLRMINEVNKSGAIVGVFSQKDDAVENPITDDLYQYGVVAKVVKVLELLNLEITNSKFAAKGFAASDIVNVKVGNFKFTAPVVKDYSDVDNGEYLVGHIYNAPETVPTNRDREFNAVVEACKDVAEKLFRSSEFRNFDMSFNLRNLSNKTFLINFICANLPVNCQEKFGLLSEDNMTQRAFMLLSLLNREYQFVSLKASIQMRTQEDLNRQQREYFLHQEMKNIQEELGEDADSDIDGLQQRAKRKKWNDKTREFFDREIGRLRRMNPQSPEYQTQYDYLDTFVTLPWNEGTKDNLNLKNAERVLNQDHFGMEKVKERILEHLAVLKTRGDFKSPIICLYGPPGVGKTSLGKSIARAMRREYIRMSLGGLHEEAEIRGHRRTYVGAMPGRIMKGIQQAKSCNPVFILDEIDKLGQDTFHGDPSSALLEVLDPEQNSAFHDNYLDCDFDLSKVMFIATANNISSIPAPLLDRMELIEVSGYLTEEKIEIAKRHLVPQQLEKLGMEKSGIKVSTDAIERIIESYTRESGVRELDKKLNKLLRKLTLQYAREGELQKKTIGEKDIEALLGPVEFTRDKYQGNDYAGVVTGLAWTSVGGEILFIETSLSKGKGQKLTLTGNLGDVMKESAVLALEYIKAHADRLSIDPRVFDSWNIHIHVPEGAVPKDGPSAGITIATSIASALTQRKVRKNVAMTGEITLRGKVLPVGGIKEKILAAKRAGITDIMLCHENEKDIKQIPEKYVKGVTFHYVENVEDVWQFALLDERVKNPVDFTIDEEKKE